MFGGITKALSSFNPIMNTLQNVSNLATSLMKGDLGGIMNAASQLAITYATGGTGALFSQVGGMLAELAVQQVTGQGGAGGSNSLGSQLGMGGASDLMSKVLTGAMGVETALATLQLIGDQMGMSQNDIDAAQGAFAEMVGEKDLAKTNYKEAGFKDRGSDGDKGWFGNKITSGEKADARGHLGEIFAGGNQQSPIGNMVAALIAGPNAGPAQLGQAQGMTSNFQNAVNNLAFALANSWLEDMRGGLTADANGNRQAGSAAGVGGGAAGGAAGGAGAGAAGGATGPGNSGTGSVNTGGNVPLSGGGSILMRIAMALGDAMDKKMDAMATKADELGAMGGKESNTNEEGGFNAEGQSKYGKASAELTALGQELKILQEALNNTLKSIGEATSGLARKQ